MSVSLCVCMYACVCLCACEGLCVNMCAFVRE